MISISQKLGLEPSPSLLQLVELHTSATICANQESHLGWKNKPGKFFRGMGSGYQCECVSWQEILQCLKKISTISLRAQDANQIIAWIYVASGTSANWPTSVWFRLGSGLDWNYHVSGPSVFLEGNWTQANMNRRIEALKSYFGCCPERSLNPKFRQVAKWVGLIDPWQISWCWSHDVLRQLTATTIDLQSCN